MSKKLQKLSKKNLEKNLTYKPFILTVKNNTLTMAEKGDQHYSFKTLDDGGLEFFPTDDLDNVAAIVQEGFVIISIKDGSYVTSSALPK